MPVPRGGPSYYIDRLYLDRILTENEIDTWLAAPQASTFWLTSPPGWGKSWLLNKIKDRYTQSGKFPVFWLDNFARFFVGKKPVLNEEELKNWIKECYDAATALYGSVIHPFVRSDDPGTSIARLAESLALVPGVGIRALLLVDGFDEMPSYPASDYQDILAAEILGRFLARNHERRNVLIAITQRAYIERYPLTISRDRIIRSLDDQIHAWDQFCQVRQELFGGSPPVSQREFDQWRHCLEVFRWDNIFANHFLFACGLDHAGAGLNRLAKDDLKDCILHLLQRPDPGGGAAKFPAIKDPDFSILVTIARLDDPFLPAELDGVIARCAPGPGITRFNHPFIKSLRAVYGVLYPDANDPTRLRLEPSLRALLRDYSAI